MPARVLVHRQAPTTCSADASLETGRWRDIAEQGQFLIDFEFLTRHTQPAPNKTRPTVIADIACIYPRSPPYLLEISRHFPWVHFYAFRHTQKADPGSETEYDPAQPELVRDTQPSLQTELNRTTSPLEFRKENAVLLSRVKEDDPERHRLVMICHGESNTRQLVLHTLLRADFSLLDVCGAIPDEYLGGDLVFPIFIPRKKMFMLLVATQSCKGECYDSGIFKDELGEHFLSDVTNLKVKPSNTCSAFFQGTLRATEAYDQASKDLIINEYARCFWWYHQCDPEAIKQTLRRIVDSQYDQHCPKSSISCRY